VVNQHQPDQTTKGNLNMKTLIMTAGILLSALVAQSSLAADTNERPVKDLSEASDQIHWPQGFEPKNVDAFVHNEIWINAPANVIWANLINVGDWPAWYSNSSDIQIEGADQQTLQVGTVFTWKTFGFPIKSTIHEYVPLHRLGWFGEGTGIRAYHTWLIVEKAGGCEVITEEAQVGPSAIKYNIEQPTAMHDGHNWWLTALKYRSEHSISKTLGADFEK
jgi:hypothetical protein